jgi:monomeric isocitrate dehydrogenase
MISRQISKPIGYYNVAQISNSVARLSNCIAEASQNNRRNPRYPELPHPSKRAHISSCSGKVGGAEMTSALRQVPLGARTVSVQLRAELAHYFTNSG